MSLLARRYLLESNMSKGRRREAFDLGILSSVCFCCFLTIVDYIDSGLSFVQYCVCLPALTVRCLSERLLFYTKAV